MEDSDVFTLTKDYVASEGDKPLTANPDRPLTLILDGHTISAEGLKHIIVAQENGSYVRIVGPGTLSLKNGRSTLKVEGDARIDLSGATVTSDDCVQTVFLYTKNGDTTATEFYMQGGTITATNLKEMSGAAPQSVVTVSGTLNIAGGRISGGGDYVDAFVTEDSHLLLKGVGSDTISSVYLENLTASFWMASPHGFDSPGRPRA